MCPPGLRLSRGQQSFLLKFLYASLFEHAAKSNEGIIVAFIAKIIVALNECYNIGGLANEMDLLKDLDTLAFHNCKANLADCYQGKQKSARVYCRSSTFAKQRTWLLIWCSRKCSTQIVATHRPGLGIVLCWSRIFCMNFDFRIVFY